VDHNLSADFGFSFSARPLWAAAVSGETSLGSWEGKMNTRVRYLCPLVILAFAPTAFATQAVPVKCAANQDQVWVYDSLSNFDVAAKLRCGETVEVISHVEGYTKVRTARGVEGYVSDAALADVPAVPDDGGKSASNATPNPSASAAARIVAPPSSTAPPSSATIASPPIVANANLAVVAAPAPAPLAQPQPAPAAPVQLVAPPPASPEPAVESVSAKVADTAASPPSPAKLSATQPASSAAHPDEDSDTQPQNESADPACQVFFSAYGLTPAQYKWLADNRRKQFSGICPAPDPSRVDYVILLTHDSDSYADAMPVPVHMDRSNGFSDFNPLTTVDTALVPTQEIERAHYEYVWVFRMKRGDFDPVNFSPRRHPQFTTARKVHHAAARAVEDAFNFIQQQGVNQ
jgi:hypothetical protein